MGSRFSAHFSFIRNTCTFNHCECLQQIFLRSVNSMVFLRMVKKYVFICCKCEECLYMSEICVHQVKVISHCKRSSPLASSTQQRGRRSTSTKQERWWMSRIFSPNKLVVDVNFLYRETHRSGGGWDGEQLLLPYSFYSFKSFCDWPEQIANYRSNPC